MCIRACVCEVAYVYLCACLSVIACPFATPTCSPCQYVFYTHTTFVRWVLSAPLILFASLTPFTPALLFVILLLQRMRYLAIRIVAIFFVCYYIYLPLATKIRRYPLSRSFAFFSSLSFSQIEAIYQLRWLKAADSFLLTHFHVVQLCHCTSIYVCMCFVACPYCCLSLCFIASLQHNLYTCHFTSVFVVFFFFCMRAQSHALSLFQHCSLLCIHYRCVLSAIDVNAVWSFLAIVALAGQCIVVRDCCLHFIDVCVYFCLWDFIYLLLTCHCSFFIVRLVELFHFFPFNLCVCLMLSLLYARYFAVLVCAREGVKALKR